MSCRISAQPRGGCDTSNCTPQSRLHYNTWDIERNKTITTILLAHVELHPTVAQLRDPARVAGVRAVGARAAFRARRSRRPPGTGARAVGLCHVQPAREGAVLVGVGRKIRGGKRLVEPGEHGLGAPVDLCGQHPQQPRLCVAPLLNDVGALDGKENAAPGHRVGPEARHVPVARQEALAGGEVHVHDELLCGLVAHVAVVDAHELASMRVAILDEELETRDEPLALARRALTRPPLASAVRATRSAGLRPGRGTPAPFFVRWPRLTLALAAAIPLRLAPRALQHCAVHIWPAAPPASSEWPRHGSRWRGRGCLRFFSFVVLCGGASGLAHELSQEAQRVLLF